MTKKEILEAAEQRMLLERYLIGGDEVGPCSTTVVGGHFAWRKVELEYARFRTVAEVEAGILYRISMFRSPDDVRDWIRSGAPVEPEKVDQAYEDAYAVCDLKPEAEKIGGVKKSVYSHHDLATALGFGVSV